ncbi:MAG TPA: sulfur transferase domain-containing protein [Gemmatimonadales bacterium]|nr:sulfur transferase domain-containing protein [Gemmatimonadales bacterium]
MSTPFEAAAGLNNRCQVLPKLLSGGQPTADHLKALKAAGVEVVVDIRDPMEPRPLDEPALVRQLGMEYINVPLVTGRQTDADMDRILAALRNNKDRQVFYHCASGNRIGGPIIPYLILDMGMEEEDAVSEAMRVGLRSAELMEWGMSYARKQQLG